MSRKKQNIQKITALYCRLSLEDGRENESMSISNQKLMLKDFAEKNGMFRYEYYVDDGYTGRNFNRPAFQRMIADIEAGKIDCVITKDLSRLGRNYIEAGSYIEIFFPKHHIRYYCYHGWCGQSDPAGNGHYPVQEHPERPCTAVTFPRKFWLAS